MEIYLSVRNQQQWQLLYTTFSNLYCPYDLQLENGQLPSPNHQMGTDRLQEEVRAGGQKLLNH
jgi:hypothetical protein